MQMQTSISWCFDRYQSELLLKIIAAMIDRLTFQSYVLDMNGESYRLAQTKKGRKKVAHFQIDNHRKVYEGRKLVLIRHKKVQKLRDK